MLWLWKLEAAGYSLDERAVLGSDFYALGAIITPGGASEGIRVALRAVRPELLIECVKNALDRLGVRLRGHG